MLIDMQETDQTMGLYKPWSWYGSLLLITHTTACKKYYQTN